MNVEERSELPNYSNRNTLEFQEYEGCLIMGTGTRLKFEENDEAPHYHSGACTFGF